MTIAILSGRFAVLPRLTGFLGYLLRKLRARRQLRHLDELPTHLLRDVGLDDMTPAERRKLGGYRFF